MIDSCVYQWDYIQIADVSRHPNKSPKGHKFIMQYHNVYLQKNNFVIVYFGLEIRQK